MAATARERDNPNGCDRNDAAGSADGTNVMATPTATWMRLARRLRRDGNPLRRRSDVIEDWLLPGVIAVFVALSPLVAVGTTMVVRADNAAAQHGAQSLHAVPAVLLEAAPGPEMSDNGANTWLVWTRASWTADGRQWTGNVPVPANTKAGSTVTIVLDRAGKVRMPPPTPAEARDHIIVAVLIAIAALALLLAALAVLSRRILDRRRLAGWESAWLSVGPTWSRQS